ncbi:uncharacterized protein LOC141691465 [Apium graveolens]|uniref:uncharacterized protein LOC141691465 n=1 Tax=Apium graveolens TaxID=4045 RepID=UPI003D796490
MEVIDVVESAKVVLNQWRCAQDNSFDHNLGLMNSTDGDEHWVCPTGETIKVNSDAAIFETSNCFSYAFVARDAEGRLIEARSRCCPGQVNPEDAEAMGIREVLSWIKEQGREAVTVETDCIVVVQAIRSDCPLLSYFGRIIQ